MGKCHPLSGYWFPIWRLQGRESNQHQMNSYSTPHPIITYSQTCLFSRVSSATDTIVHQFWELTPRWSIFYSPTPSCPVLPGHLCETVCPVGKGSDGRQFLTSRSSLMRVWQNLRENYPNLKLSKGITPLKASCGALLLNSLFSDSWSSLGPSHNPHHVCDTLRAPQSPVLLSMAIRAPPDFSEASTAPRALGLTPELGQPSAASGGCRPGAKCFLGPVPVRRPPRGPCTPLPCCRGRPPWPAWHCPNKKIQRAQAPGGQWPALPRTTANCYQISESLPGASERSKGRRLSAEGFMTVLTLSQGSLAVWRMMCATMGPRPRWAGLCVFLALGAGSRVT